MLKTLAIHNVALIDRAEISFSEGLNVLSGETGAGKSVILDSIDFVLGAKADKGMIRFGQSECFVRAEFSCDEPFILQMLSDFDIEPDDTLVISRKLNVEGKGGAKINGCAVTTTMLRQLTALLVDVHGQSEHFFLLQEANQLALLDKISGKSAEEKKNDIGSLLSERKTILDMLALLGGNEEERSRRMDVLSYQIDEIERADLKSGEEEELTVSKNRFQNAEKLLDGLSTARSALINNFDDGWCGLDAVNSAKRALTQIARYDTKYEILRERLENVATELSDIGDITDGYLDELDFDENERERIETRLDEIKTLKKKYGGSFEAVQLFLLQAQEELDLLKHNGEERDKLQIRLKDIEDKLYSACHELTVIRKETAKNFTKRVTEDLQTLNISSARFEVEFNDYDRSDTPNATKTGLDKIRFLFSANAGEPPKELSKIISGGEMSRFMLAIKAQYSRNVGTCIFDEIDAGIGGKTARVVAEKFAKIAKQTQVIAVSHLAQIASFADRQFLIEKTESDDKTYTKILQVEGDARNNELARLIAGESSELALKQADELLTKAQQYKNTI